MASKQEIVGLLAFIQSAYRGKPFSEQEVEVWVSQLEDLPAKLLEAAILKRVQTDSSPYAPSIGELRNLALELAGEQLSPSKAWVLAKDRNYWQYSEAGSVAGLSRELPEVVLETARRFGFSNLGKDQSSFAYQRFREIYVEVLSESASGKIKEQLEHSTTRAERRLGKLEEGG